MQVLQFFGINSSPDAKPSSNQSIFNSNLFTIDNLIYLVLMIAICVAMIYAVKTLLRILKKRGKITNEASFTIFQIAKYLIVVIGIIMWLGSIGIDVSALLVGSTALFVGLGLGLQKVFQDIISGLIIVFEKTIHEGDILTVDGKIVRVQKIFLRTSRVIGRDDDEIIIPNYKMISENVINWTTNSATARFHVDLGVAYGSDVEKVKDILLEVAEKHPAIQKTPAPEVFFSEFGNSSLNFKLLFFSEQVFRIERIKSNLRFDIYRRLKEESVTIPFPQQDVYIKEFPGK